MISWGGGGAYCWSESAGVTKAELSLGGTFPELLLRGEVVEQSNL